MNSVNGGREVEERLNKKKNERNKKENKRNKEVGAKISAPTLKTQPRAKLTQSTQKKKNIFQSFQVSFKIQIFNSNFHSQILNAQILNSNHKFSKIRASDFMIKISRPNFQNFNAQNFEF